MSICKFLCVVKREVGTPQYKCLIDNYETLFPTIKEGFESLHKDEERHAVFNHECPFAIFEEDEQCPLFNI